MALTKPYSEQAERAVLGAALLKEDAANFVVSVCNDEDFYVNSNKLVFRAILDCKKDGLKVDITNVATKLSTIGVLESVGGVSELVSLTESVLSENIENYTDSLKEKNNLRKMSELLEKYYNNFDNDVKKNASELLMNFEDEALKVTRFKNGSSFVSVSELIDGYYEVLNSPTSITKPIETGYKYVDKVFNGGLNRGDLLILAARPGMGKTQFALNVCYNVARKDPHGKILFFSTEMGGDQLAKRLISVVGNIPSDDVLTFQFKDRNKQIQLSDATEKIKKLPIHIDDTSSILLTDLLAKCRSTHKRLKEGEKINLIIVDYLQRVRCPNKKNDRTQEVGEISTALKALARELNVPVIALAQLNRSGESNFSSKTNQVVDKRPQIHNLAESGKIEQDADIIMFIHRDAYYLKGIDQSANQEAELIIAKNRNGRPDTAFFTYNPPCGRYTASLKETKAE